MMKRFHLAVGVADIASAVLDYSRRLACDPVVVVDGEYALWRTETLNFSIRKTTEEAGLLRHLGWEDAGATAFYAEKDVNGILWESFSAQQQADEIQQLWPSTQYQPE